MAVSILVVDPPDSVGDSRSVLTAAVQHRVIGSCISLTHGKIQVQNLEYSFFRMHITFTPS